jgi:hypothetical protein
MGVLTGANINELQTRIKQAVDQGLARRGYRLVAKTAPHDMEVTAMVSASNEIQYSEHAVTSNRAYQTTVAWSQLNDYLKGALLIILTEPESRDIIWRGTASENLKNNSNRNEGTVEKFTNLITDQLPMSSRP